MYKEFRTKIEETDSRLSNLQKAEDDYYLTANYLLQLANRAYELFESSEIEQKRQLLKSVPQNLTLEGRLVQYDAIKPFDTILNYADHKLWLPLLDSNLKFTVFRRVVICFFYNCIFDRENRICNISLK